MNSARMLQLAAWDYSFELHLLPLLNACRDAGFDVTCAGAPGPFVNAIRDRGFPYHPLPLRRDGSPLSHARALLAIRALLRAKHFDIIHTHTFLGGLLGRFAAAKHRVPVSVYTAHGFRFHERMNRLSYSALLTCERGSARITDLIFVQNDEDRQTALRHAFLPPDRIVTIGSGIALDAFDPALVSAQTRRSLRRELGVPEDAVVATTIARPTREKGAPEFVELARALVPKQPRCHFVGVFPELPGERNSLRTRLRRQLPDRFHLLGFRNDVRDLLAISDVFVLPTQFEGWSRVTMEAMAMAVPVVASNVRGCRGVVDDQSGRLVPPGNHSALRSAVEELLTNEVLRRQLGRHARERALRDFDQARSIELQLRAMRELLGRAERQA